MDLLTIVEWATVAVTFIVLGSGLPVCVQMYKTGSTKNVPYFLFLVYSFVNVLSLKYGVYNNNLALMLISSFSLLVFGTYIAFFIWFSKSKRGPLTTLSAVVVVYLGHLLYLTQMPSVDVVPTIGIFLRAWCTILALVPIMDIITMVKEQSADSCEIPILISTTISALTWYWYGSLSDDINIWAPNIPALILCAVQYFLVWYFRKSSKSMVHPVRQQSRNGFMGQDFHKEVYDIRSRKPLLHNDKNVD